MNAAISLTLCPRRWRTPAAVLIAGSLYLSSACTTTPDTRQEVTAPAEAAAAATPTRLTIVAVGDIMLGGTAAPEMQRYGFDYPFEPTRRILERADIVFGNLEGPLTMRGEPTQAKEYVFRSPPDKVAGALARANFKVVSLANNHTLDYGVVGLEDTIAALDAAGVRHTGAGKNLAAARTPAYLDVAGRKVAFLAYSLTFPEQFWATPDRAGTAFGHEAHVRADVTAARLAADLVIVSFHWGTEHQQALRPYQPMLARAAIESGASLVIGHHPHVLQGIERYRDAVIFYSLGNFAFGSYNPLGARSGLVHATFDGHCLADVELIPLNTMNSEVVFQPTPLAGHEADAVVTQLQKLSASLGTTIENRGGKAGLRIGCVTSR